MNYNYRTVHQQGEDEITINKSLFIGYSCPVKSEEEALKFIEEIRKKHKDATHNVYAYVIGENSNIQRYNDDGEPSGTAGIPVLEVMKKENLRNVAVVVTRYFGGVKLGAGGLVRAYTKGAKIGLDAGIIVERMVYKRVLLRIDYALLGKVENELVSLKFIIENILYKDVVDIIVLCREEKVDFLKNSIIEVTGAKVSIEELGEDMFSVKEGEILY